MRRYELPLNKWMRVSHKWAGISLAMFLLLVSITGLLLLHKKSFTFLQPPTLNGSAGDIEQMISTQQLLAVVLAQNHPDFQSVADLDRIAFRPTKRVHKVRSKHNHSELQVDAITGAILSDKKRNSDLIESLHDGTWFAGWVHSWLMTVVALGVFYLALSGLYLWLQPLYRKSRRKSRS